MAYPGDSIEIATVEQYNRDVVYASQQLDSKQRNTVGQKTIKGRSDYVDVIGTTEVEEKTTRNARTPDMDVGHGRRLIVPRDYHWGASLDRSDDIRILINREAPYLRSSSAAFGRQMDRTLNAALIGVAKEGMTGETSVPLPDSQKIGLTANVAFTSDLLRWAKYLFKKNDVQDPFFYIAASPYQLYELLGDIKATSADYVTGKVLEGGNITGYMGFKFIWNSHLPFDPATNKRSCIAYTNMSAKLGWGKDMLTKVGENPERTFNKTLYQFMSLGSVRLEEVRVVEMLCYEEEEFEFVGETLSFGVEGRKLSATTPTGNLKNDGLLRELASSDKESLDAIKASPDSIVRDATGKAIGCSVTSSTKEMGGDQI